MINVLPLIIQYRHYLGYGLVVLGVLFFLQSIRNHGYKQCEQDQAIKVMKTVEKRNEISSKRPDDSVTIKRLQDGTF